MSTFDYRRTPETAAVFARVVLFDMAALRMPLPHVMGSLRRANAEEAVEQTIGDLDLLIVGEEMPENLPGYLTATKKKAHGWRSIDDLGRMMVDLWLCPAESVGPFAFFLTGPQTLNVAMRQLSQDAGLMLTQYGLFEPVAAPTKTYPHRVKPGRRIDDPTGPAIAPWVAEQAFWDTWTDAVGLKVPCPLPYKREEVTRWLQGRVRATRSVVTTGG